MARSSLFVGAVAFAAALLAIFCFRPTELPPSEVEAGISAAEEDDLGATQDDGPPVIRVPVKEVESPNETDSGHSLEPTLMWYEDEALMAAARAEYPAQLESVKARVATYAVRGDGAEMIRRSVAHGYFLFDSEEFPITAEDVIATDQLDQIDLANALNMLAGNRKRVGQWIDELDDGRQEGVLRSMKRDPMNYPPSLLMQIYTGNSRVELDPDFVLDARDLYLREWPRLYDARRESSIGTSAASQALSAVGVDQAQIGQTFKEFGRLSPEVEAGQAMEDAIEQEFLIEFQALVQKYYF